MVNNYEQNLISRELPEGGLGNGEWKEYNTFAILARLVENF